MAERGPSENLLCKNDQTLSVNANPLDLFDQSLLLDMIILGTHQLRGGVNIFFFYKVSFEKHPNEHGCRQDQPLRSDSPAHQPPPRHLIQPAVRFYCG